MRQPGTDRVLWLEPTGRGSYPNIYDAYDEFKYVPSNKWQSVLKRRQWAWVPRKAPKTRNGEKMSLSSCIRFLIKERDRDL